jgi:hypothetical protein
LLNSRALVDYYKAKTKMSNEEEPIVFTTVIDHSSGVLDQRTSNQAIESSYTKIYQISHELNRRCIMKEMTAVLILIAAPYKVSTETMKTQGSRVCSESY